MYPYIFFALTKDQMMSYPKRSWSPNYSEKLYRHEWIHVEQVRRMGWFKFYATYLFRMIGKNRFTHPYEKEAYGRQKDPWTDEIRQAWKEDFDDEVNW